MMTIEIAWWILFALNLSLFLYLVYRHIKLRMWYEAMGDSLHEEYNRVEGHALDEGDRYMDARKEYEEKLKELSIGETND